MRNFLLLIVCMLSFQVIVPAQYNLKENNVWVFGLRAGLDFNSGTPVPITTSMTSGGTNAAPEGCTAVSDANGQLLFYTMGDTIWNKNHVAMPNGYNMLPVPSGTKCAINKGGGIYTVPVNSTTQGVLIAPVMGNSNQYYVFCLQQACNLDTRAGRLFYSIVDMTLNNGLGDVVSGSKGIKIDSFLSEKMIAVKGDCKMWVVTHTSRTDTFKAYEITQAGLNTTPVISVTGSITGTNAYNIGAIKISPDRKKLAIASSGTSVASGIGLELCDFNVATGEVSNAIKLNTDANYGVCFSPDNTRLYTNSIFIATTTSSIFQYDISLPTLADIVNSKTFLHSQPDVEIKDMQLGPDGKIYLPARASTLDSMDVIDLPNTAGTACQFKHNAFKLANGTQVSGGIHNLYIKATGPDTVITTLDTTICTLTSLTLKGHPGSATYKWNNGSATADTTISQGGTYWVLSTDGCYTFVDTFIIKGDNFVKPLITINGFTLGTTLPYSHYQWYLNNTLLPNETNATITVTQNGFYTVKVYNVPECSDTASYLVTNVGIAELSQLAASIKIYPNPATDIIYVSSAMPAKVTVNSIDGRNVINGYTNSNIGIAHLVEGLYLVRVIDNKGNIIKTEKIVKAR